MKTKMLLLILEFLVVSSSCQQHVGEVVETVDSSSQSYDISSESGQTFDDTFQSKFPSPTYQDDWYQEDSTKDEDPLLVPPLPINQWYRPSRQDDFGIAYHSDPGLSHANEHISSYRSEHVEPFNIQPITSFHNEHVEPSNKEPITSYLNEHVESYNKERIPSFRNEPILPHGFVPLIPYPPYNTHSYSTEGVLPSSLSLSQDNVQRSKQT